MLKIAVQNPGFAFADESRNYNGYNYIFFQKYATAAYRCTQPIDTAQKERKFFGKPLLFDAEALNKQADVLVCFNGEPYLFGNEPEAGFYGLKLYHAMDYVFRASESCRLYRTAGVDYLFGYCRHDIHSPFFQEYYGPYQGKVIDVPFGYGQRFLDADKPFEERQNKAVALGSVNPVDDPLCPPGILDEYKSYYGDEQFTHKLRRTIVLNRKAWQEEIDSTWLPDFPDTKNVSYDPVTVMNEYTMFINDAGIMNFPPARTYEGIAAGCVMVGEELPVYAELGFRDGYNAILFEPGKYEQMIEKIRYYQVHIDELRVIHENAKKLLPRYTHEQIADRLYETIKGIAGQRGIA